VLELRPRALPTARGLVNILGVPVDEAVALSAEMQRAQIRNPGRKIDWQTAVREYVTKMWEKYDAAVAAPRAQWWITQDPGRQWTASRHPTPTDCAGGRQVRGRRRDSNG